MSGLPYDCPEPSVKWRYTPAPTTAQDPFIGKGASDVYIGSAVRVWVVSLRSAPTHVWHRQRRRAEHREPRYRLLGHQSNCTCLAVHVGGVYFRDSNTPNYHILKEGETPPPAPMVRRIPAEKRPSCWIASDIGPQTPLSAW